MRTNSILKNATEDELGRAVEENVFAMFMDMTRVLNGEREEKVGLSRYHASPSSPIFKGAYRTHLTADETDEAILDTIAWSKARAAPFFFWWIGNDTEPSDLGVGMLSFLPARWATLLI